MKRLSEQDYKIEQLEKQRPAIEQEKVEQILEEN